MKNKERQDQLRLAAYLELRERGPPTTSGPYYERYWSARFHLLERLPPEMRSWVYLVKS